MEIKIFKKKKSFRKGGFHTNPNLGWQIIVIMAFGIVAVFFSFGFYLFLQGGEEFEVPSPSNLAGEQIINRGRLGQALEYFAEKKAKSTAILDAPAKVVDPSL